MKKAKPAPQPTDPIYRQAVLKYAAAGIIIFPIDRLHGKKPAIKRPHTVGSNAMWELADKFPNANVGLYCGRKNGLVIVDIDTVDSDVLDFAIERFGETPVIVTTGSGKHHLYYRSSGERRAIRPFDDLPIDILGNGGYVVAPPSRLPSGGLYRFTAGGISDLAHLPTIKPGALDIAQSARTAVTRPTIRIAPVVEAVNDNDRIPEGKRNDWLFGLALREVKNCRTKPALMARLRDANQSCDPPLPDSEVETICEVAFRYEAEGRNWVGQEARARITKSEFERLRDDPVALALLVMLRLIHGHRHGNEFVLANETAKSLGWSLPRFRAAKARLITEGFLKLTNAGGRRGPGDTTKCRLV